MSSKIIKPYEETSLCNDHTALTFVRKGDKVCSDFCVFAASFHQAKRKSLTFLITYFLITRGFLKA